MIATKMVLKVLEKFDKISPKPTCNVKKIGPPPGGPKSPEVGRKVRWERYTHFTAQFTYGRLARYLAIPYGYLAFHMGG